MSETKRRAIGLVAVLLTANGCTAGLQGAVHEYAAAVRVTTQPSLVLIDRCKAGEKEACDVVKQNLEALDASAARLAERVN